MRSSGGPQLDHAGGDRFQTLLEGACAEAMPAWLETRRWFADKGRGIARVTIEDALIEPVKSNWLALAVIGVEFEDGNVARYLLPLTLSETRSSDDVIAATVSDSHDEVISDATATAWFGEWLLAHLERSSETPDGAWRFVSHPAAEPAIAMARTHPPTLVRAEQSNSSLLFDDALIVKLFRRLQSGPNPEEEVLRALANVGFKQAPRYVGSISWRSPTEEKFAIAVAQEFVPNCGDGWTWMLRRLENVAGRGAGSGLDDFEAERLLGQRTGELHATLGSVTEPGFVPELADDPAIAENTRRTLSAIDDTVDLLQERRDRLPQELATRLPAAIKDLKSLSSRVEGYGAEAHTSRIRAHGDFHLGQTLRTPDNDWTIIDFEGEPARPLDERRQRTSALKDVAGMLRSFAYARGATEKMPHLTGDLDAVVRLNEWESGARRAFLEGYRSAVKNAAVCLVPEDDDTFESALAAWELDKALYEVAYEARNRPDWIYLPLRGLLPDLLDQPADGDGASPA